MAAPSRTPEKAEPVLCTPIFRAVDGDESTRDAMTPAMRDVIDQLKARRHDLGINQIVTDDIVGCASGLVAKWECGARVPNFGSLVNWSVALGCELRIVGEPVPAPFLSARQVIEEIYRHGCRLELVPVGPARKIYFR